MKSLLIVLCFLILVTSVSGQRNLVILESAGTPSQQPIVTSFDRIARQLDSRWNKVSRETKVELVSSQMTFADRFDETIAGNVFQTVSELKQRQGLIDLPIFGSSTSVYIRSGIRWRVDRDTTRSIEFRRGVSFKQKYEFRTGNDLFNYVIRNPVQKHLLRHLE